MNLICKYCNSKFTTNFNLNRHISTSKTCIENRSKSLNNNEEFKSKITNLEKENALLKQKLEFNSQLLIKEQTYIKSIKQEHKEQISKLESQIIEYKSQISDYKEAYDAIIIDSMIDKSSTTNNVTNNTTINNNFYNVTYNLDPIYDEESKSYYLPYIKKLIKENINKLIVHQPIDMLVRSLIISTDGFITINGHTFRFYDPVKKEIIKDDNGAIFMGDICNLLIVKSESIKPSPIKDGNVKNWEVSNKRLIDAINNKDIHNGYIILMDKINKNFYCGEYIKNVGSDKSKGNLSDHIKFIKRYG